MAKDKNKKDKISEEIDSETDDMTAKDAKEINPEVAEKEAPQPAEPTATKEEKEQNEELSE